MLSKAMEKSRDPDALESVDRTATTIQIKWARELLNKFLLWASNSCEHCFSGSLSLMFKDSLVFC